jgi:hypothetical protein
MYAKVATISKQGNVVVDSSAIHWHRQHFGPTFPYDSGTGQMWSTAENNIKDLKHHRRDICLFFEPLAIDQKLEQQACEMR